MKPRINTNAYADMNKVKQDYNDMAAVVDSVEIKGATRYEKVKFFPTEVKKLLSSGSVPLSETTANAFI